MKKYNIANAVMISIIGAGVAISTSTTALAAKKETEKCYGIAKKGMNDCGTAKHACASLAKADNDKNEWIYVLKGNCQRIVGGSLNSDDSNSDSN